MGQRGDLMDRKKTSGKDARGRKIRFFKPKKNLNIKVGGEISSHELQDSAFARLEAIEKKRTRVRSIVLVLSVVLVMALTIGVVNLLLQRKTSNPSLQFLMSDRVDESFEVRGIIVRDETMYSAGLSGIIRPLKPEATKVAKAENVAMVLSPAMQDTYEQWKEVVSEISKRRLELIAQGQGQGSSQIFSETDVRMIPLINDLRKASSFGTVKNVDSVQNSVDALVYSRNLKLDTITFQDPTLDELHKKLEALDLVLQKQAVYLRTDSSGYISYMSDGLESILTPTSLSSLNESNINKILSDGENYKPISESVKLVAPAYRLSKGSGQTLVLLVKDLPTSFFEIGEGARHISVYLPRENLTIADCIVRSISEASEGTILSVTTSSQVENLIDRRIIEGRIIVDSTYGYKVPNAVLLNYRPSTRRAQLMIVSQGVTKLVEVNVSAQNDRFSVVQDLEGNTFLSEGTIYVENPQDVKEGHPID